MSEQLPPLIVDTNLEFLASISSDPKAASAKPLTATSANEALAIIKGPNRISGIFINALVAEPFGLPLVQASIENRPNTPVFLVLDDAKDKPEDVEIKNALIQEVLFKPLTYTQILNHIAGTQLDFDIERALEIASENVEQLDQEVSADDGNYCPIRASNFIAGGASFFDLYVKLAPGKYVKIIQAGDTFSPERLNSYLNKGVEHFHIRLEAQDHYLRYCGKLAGLFLKAKSATQEIKISHTLNQGQETLSFLRNCGVSEKLLRYSERFAQNVAALVEQVNFPERAMLTKLMADLLSFEHGVSTSMVAALIAKTLNFEADKSVQVVGLASLLHDVGLVDLDDKFKAEDESKLTKEEIVIYYTHPQRGADALRGIRGIDAGVLQAIEQHHERRNRTGFPNRLGSSQINRVAEIIGISEDFLKLVDKVKKGELKRHPLMEMQVRAFDGFSTPVVTAFQAVFDPPKGKK